MKHRSGEETNAVLTVRIGRKEHFLRKVIGGSLQKKSKKELKKLEARNQLIWRGSPRSEQVVSVWLVIYIITGCTVSV